MHERRIAALRRALAEQWPRLLLAALLTAALWPLAGRGASDSAGLEVPHEWPREWDGDALRPLALTAVEQRFAERFPGHIGRFAAEGRVWVLRDRKGRTAVVDNLGAVWVEAERLCGRPLDPLDADLIAALS